MHGRRIWFGIHFEVNLEFGIGFGKSWILHSSQQFFGRCCPSVKGLGDQRGKKVVRSETTLARRRKHIPCAPLNLISIDRIYLNRWVDTALLNLIGMVNNGAGLSCGLAINGRSRYRLADEVHCHRYEQAVTKSAKLSMFLKRLLLQRRTSSSH